MTWQLVETDAELRTLLDREKSCEAVIVDTEFMRQNTFFPQVALLQLSFDNGTDDPPIAWLVDPLKVSDLQPIIELMINTAVVKVLHSASEDIEVFSRWLGVLPDPLFDTQKAAALLNMGFGLGYRALVLELLDVDLPKGETRSDWLQRPLTEAQCEYAAQDVTCLLPVWRTLRDRALQQQKYDWVLADGADTINAAQAPADDYYHKIKGAWKLNQEQLQALAAICEWREETARIKDKPRGWIVDDRACLQLALVSPQSEAQLSAIEDLPAAVVRKHGGALLEILGEGSDAAMQNQPRAIAQPLDNSGRNHLKKLKQRARSMAEVLNIAPEAILPSKDYELLVREAMGQSIEEPLHWSGWRSNPVISPLRNSAKELVS